MGREGGRICEDCLAGGLVGGWGVGRYAGVF